MVDLNLSRGIRGEGMLRGEERLLWSSVSLMYVRHRIQRTAHKSWCLLDRCCGKSGFDEDVFDEQMRKSDAMALKKSKASTGKTSDGAEKHVATEQPNANSSARMSLDTNVKSRASLDEANRKEVVTEQPKAEPATQMSETRGRDAPGGGEQSVAANTTTQASAASTKPQPV